jgi:hypothetical protein
MTRYGLSEAMDFIWFGAIPVPDAISQVDY